MGYNWTTTDYNNLLLTQLQLLKLSNASYDSGERIENLRIATTLRVLLHDTTNTGSRKNSKSLLNQMGLKNSIDFYSTHDPSNFSVESCSSLTTRCIKGNLGQKKVSKSEICPRIEAGTNSKFLDFTSWWNEIVIQVDSSSWSRGKLVKDASNKLGGAHVDPSPSNGLIRLNQETRLIEVINIDGKVITKNVEGDQFSASIRQISYEFLKSIATYNSDWDFLD